MGINPKRIWVSCRLPSTAQLKFRYTIPVAASHASQLQFRVLVQRQISGIQFCCRPFWGPGVPL